MMSFRSLSPTFKPATPATPVTRVLTGLALSVALVLSPAAHAGSEQWTTGFVEARSEASSTDKDLLLLFTGSDWCPPCIVLEDEVLAKPDFAEATAGAFVPVLLDFPNGKPQPDATRRQNGMLHSQYKIRGFPTILLTDARGMAYAEVDFTADLVSEGPVAYAAHLMQLRQIRRVRDAAFAEAEAATGLDRARALDRGLAAVGPEMAADFYGNVLADVVALDPDNEAGLKAKYERLLNQKNVEQELKTVFEHIQAGQPRRALDDVGGMIERYQPQGEMLQTLEMVRAQIHFMLQEPDEGRTAFERSIAAAPDSPAVPEIREMAEASAAAAGG